MDLCTEELGTRELHKFVKECFRYEYESKPDYKYLRSLLRDLIYKYDPNASEYEHKLNESLNVKKVLPSTIGSSKHPISSIGISKSGFDTASTEKTLLCH